MVNNEMKKRKASKITKWNLAKKITSTFLLPIVGTALILASPFFGEKYSPRGIKELGRIASSKLIEKKPRFDYSLNVKEKEIIVSKLPDWPMPYRIVDKDGDLIPDYVEKGLVASVRFAYMKREEPRKNDRDLFSKVVKNSNQYHTGREKDLKWMDKTFNRIYRRGEK